MLVTRGSDTIVVGCSVGGKIITGADEGTTYEGLDFGAMGTVLVLVLFLGVTMSQQSTREGARASDL